MAYTPTVYTNDASSPDLDATNLNKSEQGIKDAHLISVPVDCSSRGAEYTGDGIPLIPDNMAGRTYFQDAWATTDGWTGITVSNGIASISGTAVMYKTFTVPAGSTVMIRYKTNVNKPLVVDFGAEYAKLSLLPKPPVGVWGYYVLYRSAASTASKNGIYLVGRTADDLVEIDTIYIGNGAYDTPALDRAGNGNSLALTAVTPVNGKYGKEMSFNGTTSYAQASSPVIGTTGTVAVRWKRNRIGTAETILSNQSASTDGIRYHVDTSNNLYAVVGGSSPVSILIKSGFTDITASHTFGIKFSATSATPFYDGAEGTEVSATQVLGLANLAIGRNQIDSTGYASGQGCFRVDSRIWTADEARAWSLNPISIDSRM